jgi:hypothetical protein
MAPAVTTDDGDDLGPALPGGTLTGTYDARIAGEYFTRDGNMNLLYQVLGEILGQLGQSIGGPGVDPLDTMFVPDGSKVQFDTYLTGMPPTAIDGTIVGFMNPAMPWWFTLKIKTYNAAPISFGHVYSSEALISAGETAATDGYPDDLGYDDSYGTAMRLDADDYEEWTGVSAPDDSEYVFVYTTTGSDLSDMSNWTWTSDETWKYPDETTAPQWRQMGAKSIAWDTAEHYASSANDFGTANYMTWQQTSKLTNWFDTMVSSDIIAMWFAESSWGAPSPAGMGGDPARYGVQAGTATVVETDDGSMVSIDDNMVLDYEDVSPVVPSGDWGSPRTNPYQTSTFDAEDTSEDPYGNSVYVVSTASETVEQLKIRYRQLQTSKTTAENFIESQSKLIESTLYSSIGMKHYTTKMQRSLAMTNPYTIAGSPSAAPADSTTTLDPNAAVTIEEVRSATRMTTLDSDGGGYGGY